MALPAVGSFYSFNYVGGEIHDPEIYSEPGAMYWGKNANGEHVFGNVRKFSVDGLSTSIDFYVFQAAPRNLRQVNGAKGQGNDSSKYLEWFQSGKLELPKLPPGYSRDHTYTSTVQVPVLAAGGFQVIGEKPERMILFGGAVFAHETASGFHKV